jgi:hypothetical protein
MSLPTDDTQKFTIVAGDRLRLPQGVLTDSDGNAINLLNMTLTFRMVDARTGVAVVDDRPALSMQTDENPATWGRCTYTWGSGDTDTPGLYRASFKITSLDGLSTTFPPDGDWFILIIDA